MNRDPGTAAPHLDPALVAAYLDDGLAGSERSEVEAHLAECQECADELVAVHRLKPVAERAFRTPRRPLRIVFAASAVAAVLAILVLRPGTESDTPIPDGLPRQRADSQRPAPIHAESPTEGEEVLRGELFFSWTSDRPGGGPYRLVVMSERGDSLWGEESMGERIAPPPTLILEEGRTYLWSVQAFDETGRPISSGLHAFRVLP